MTVRENLLPAAMVPGLVTVEDKDGKQKNMFPVDAKEAINSGDYKLVENGAVEAARLAATPLRSGMASGIPDNLIVAEISGVEGRVVIAGSEKERDKIQASGDNADAVPAKPKADEGKQTRAEIDAGGKPPAENKSAGAGAADKK